MGSAVFVDLANFYSRLIRSSLGEPRELRDYFLDWLDLDLLTKWLTGECAPTWVFYSGNKLGAKSERIESTQLNDYIKRISRLQGVTPFDVNIPGIQREAFTSQCECGQIVSGQWESEKGIDASLIVHLFDTTDSWDEAFLLSGDADFTPAVRSLRRRGKRVSGAGFQGASETLVRELFRFEDLAKKIIREDFAAYLLFGKDKAIESWLKTSLNSAEVISDQHSIKLRCKWYCFIEEEDDKPYVFQQGRWLMESGYFNILFEDEGVADDTRLTATLDRVIKLFPEFHVEPRHFVLSRASWERVSRAHDRLLKAYSGHAINQSGQLETTWSRQADGAFRRTDATA